MKKIKTELAEVKVSYSTSIKAADRKKVTCSNDVADLFRNLWSIDIELKEAVYLLLLNRANKVLGYHLLSIGGLSGCIMDIRLIYQVGLLCNASSIIIAHNHPSGNTEPSEVDKRITQKLKRAGETMDIALLDHLIITNESYYSFADEGMI
ncbi:JAB domain-containing protein [Carboxylicivirga taeanensis]|uniref:JAB domain-containing protein n=1 Tax=Carboxylicivirga taeanensis TaxID=1416875 RepID=UPI003F6DCACB